MGSNRALGSRRLGSIGTSSCCHCLARVPSDSCGFVSAAHPGGSHDCGGMSMIAVLPAAHQKVCARHLQRQALLYVRQSTLHQVLENTESTAWQYALRERAVILGWHPEQIVVIDQDLGQSGASAVDRAGFQRLVAEVGLGKVGLVLGLEVSRLARSSSDWHHLLEICALTGTLILDEDGLYDPSAFNDRLLLGLKGAMSEAELHVLRARLQGGILELCPARGAETALARWSGLCRGWERVSGSRRAGTTGAAAALCHLPAHRLRSCHRQILS